MLAAVAGMQYRSDEEYNRLQYRSDKETFLRRVDTASPARMAGLGKAVSSSAQHHKWSPQT